MRYRPYFAVLALAFVAGCADPVGPGAVTGASFSLRALPPATLPVLMSATINCDYWLYDAQLVVTSADSAALTLNTVLDCTRGGAAPDTADYMYSGGVSQSGTQLTFSGLPLSPGTVESSRGVARGITTTLTASGLTLGAYVPLYFVRD
jgi:hypothetical protein